MALPNDLILEIRHSKAGGGEVVARMKLLAHTTKETTDGDGRTKGGKAALRVSSTQFTLANGQRVWFSGATIVGMNGTSPSTMVDD